MPMLSKQRNSLHLRIGAVGVSFDLMIFPDGPRYTSGTLGLRALIIGMNRGTNMEAVRKKNAPDTLPVEQRQLNVCAGDLL